jgi:hypothetical protein
MDDDRIVDMIREVSRQGERIGMPVTAAELRSGSPTSRGGASASREVRTASNGWRRFGRLAAVAALVLVATPLVAAIVYVALPLSNHPGTRNAAGPTTLPRGVSTTTPGSTTSTSSPPPSGGQTGVQSAVARAIEATDASGNFDLSFILTNSGGAGGTSDVTGTGTVDLSPTIAMNLNDVMGVDLWFDPNNAWELFNGSTNYSEYTLAGFSEYAEGVVGNLEGALGTFGFCSPTGLFDLSENSIGPTTEVGPTTVDGIATTEYRVTIDPSSFLEAPNVTSAEQAAIQDAITILGSGPVTDDIYVDAQGDVVRSLSTTDDVSLRVDLSNFGTAGTVTFPPPQTQIVQARWGVGTSQPDPSTGVVGSQGTSDTYEITTVPYRSPIMTTTTTVPSLKGGAST